MFHDWDNYYVVLGTAAGGLIGLLFVVVTLTAGFERSRAMLGANLYFTPTMVHFAVVLSISAIALAPGLSRVATVLAFAIGAAVGLAQAVRAGVGIRGATFGSETPHWTDFWTYGVTPAVVYVGLIAAIAGLAAGAAWAVEAISALLLILLLVGIRNAWDLVTWIAPMSTPGSGG